MGGRLGASGQEPQILQTSHSLHRFTDSTRGTAGCHGRLLKTFSIPVCVMIVLGWFRLQGLMAFPFILFCPLCLMVLCGFVGRVCNSEIASERQPHLPNSMAPKFSRERLPGVAKATQGTPSRSQVGFSFGLLTGSPSFFQKTTLNLTSHCSEGGASRTCLVFE